MRKATFQRESIEAVTMMTVQPDNADYWRGYRRGQRRAHFGERFGTEEEHQRWLKLAESFDESLAERGRGYRDGLLA